MDKLKSSIKSEIFLLEANKMNLEEILSKVEAKETMKEKVWDVDPSLMYKSHLICEKQCSDIIEGYEEIKESASEEALGNIYQGILILRRQLRDFVIQLENMVKKYEYLVDENMNIDQYSVKIETLTDYKSKAEELCENISATYELCPEIYEGDANLVEETEDLNNAFYFLLKRVETAKSQQYIQELHELTVVKGQSLIDDFHSVSSKLYKSLNENMASYISKQRNDIYQLCVEIAQTIGLDEFSIFHTEEESQIIFTVREALTHLEECSFDFFDDEAEHFQNVRFDAFQSSLEDLQRIRQRINSVFSEIN